MSNQMPRGLTALVVSSVILGACATRTTVTPTAASRRFDPVCVEGVAAFDDFSKVPYDYYEVAFVQAEGNSVYTGQGDILLAMRKRAGEQGGNAIVVNSLKATGAPVKVLGAVLGSSDADRKGKSVAIYMPADSARVKNACGRS